MNFGFCSFFKFNLIFKTNPVFDTYEKFSKDLSKTSQNFILIKSSKDCDLFLDSSLSQNNHTVKSFSYFSKAFSGGAFNNHYPLEKNFVENKTNFLNKKKIVPY